MRIRWVMAQRRPAAGAYRDFLEPRRRPTPPPLTDALTSGENQTIACHNNDTVVSIQNCYLRNEAICWAQERHGLIQSMIQILALEKTTDSIDIDRFTAIYTGVAVAHYTANATIPHRSETSFLLARFMDKRIFRIFLDLINIKRPVWRLWMQIID